MAGLTTHTYILYRALAEIQWQPATPLFAQVVESHNAALSHARKNDAKGLGTNPSAILSGCAYIGACGPDLFYLEQEPHKGTFIADLLHYNRSGPYMIWWLRRLREQIESFADRPILMRQFAYCLGHISHIAADITIHPYVNSIVGAYPKNPVVFKNNNGVLWKVLWKFHNILEHYQDSYVLHRRFIGEEKMGPDQACVNLALPAANALGASPKNYIGLVEPTRIFYRYKTPLEMIEKSKYDFFANITNFLNVGRYYSDVIPSEKKMSLVPRLTQGGRFDEETGKLIEPGLFDKYIEQAVGLTLAMWKEAASFLGGGKNEPAPFAGDEAHMLLSSELALFPLLRKHWNLDCGIAPTVRGGNRIRTVPPGSTDTSFNVAGTLSFEPVVFDARPDIVNPV